MTAKTSSSRSTQHYVSTDFEWEDLASYVFLSDETSPLHVAPIIDHKELKKPSALEQICLENQDLVTILRQPYGACDATNSAHSL